MGGLQYSATAGSAIDEHVVVMDQNSTSGPVTFDLQMSAVNLSGVIECNLWGTAIPST